MIFSGYLVFKKNSHYKGSLRLCINKPTVGANELPLNIRFDIPDSLFTRPTLQAEFKIPDVSKEATSISTELIGDIEEAFKSKGIEIMINLPDNYFKDENGVNVISDSRIYECLGNGWTVDVIAHQFEYLKQHLK